MGCQSPILLFAWFYVWGVSVLPISFNGGTTLVIKVTALTCQLKAAIQQFRK